jgi:hypothetical protein
MAKDKELEQDNIPMILNCGCGDFWECDKHCGNCIQHCICIHPWVREFFEEDE